jgi:hypothetical protein
MLQGEQTEKDGAAFVRYSRTGTLICIGYKPIRASDPTKAEAMALHISCLQGVREYDQETKVISCTDCKAIVDMARTGDMDLLPSWRVAEWVMRLKQFIDRGQGSMQIQYVGREALGDPHRMANMALRTGQSFLGMPDQIRRREHDIHMELSRGFFRRIGFSYIINNKSDKNKF